MSATRKPRLLENGHADNFQTPASALAPLLPYLPPRESTIWEPACGKGNLARGLADAGYYVQASDVVQQTGYRDGMIDWWCTRDFLSHWQPPHWHAIVTNPPFSKKHQFLARCYELGKPFALLLPLTVFDSAKRQALFARHGVQVIYMPQRINFETPSGKQDGKAWFATCWVTWGLNLPRDIIFAQPARAIAQPCLDLEGVTL